ncbi:serine/threonine-protein kinase [Streptomyces sp. NPDC001523]|uniref:serine/threonine-protein kinase n=1 Tax=Streptomyces sp. NPDC001523 TaxID=3154383 RepID=UPI0033277684
MGGRLPLRHPADGGRLRQPVRHLQEARLAVARSHDPADLRPARGCTRCAGSARAARLGPGGTQTASHRYCCRSARGRLRVRGGKLDRLLEGDPTSIGPYKLVARLGAGGMGHVYLGRSPSGRSVAVKVVRSELTEAPGFRQRFRREVVAAQRVGGFWTAAVVNADPDAELPWVASEYIDAPDLGTLVGRNGPLRDPLVRRLGAGLAEALADIHRAGLVHRDLKPSNILVTGNGPRVIDFGIAKVLDGGTALTITGNVIGTPAFMSPEQAVGTEVDAASDIFSLGAVLAYATTGRSPFGITGSSHALLYRVVHEEPDLTGTSLTLRQLLARCLAKQPAVRPTAQQLIELLAAPTPTELQLPIWPGHVDSATDLPIWQQATQTSIRNSPTDHKEVSGTPDNAEHESSDDRYPANWWSLGSSFQPPAKNEQPGSQEPQPVDTSPSPPVWGFLSAVIVSDRIEHQLFGVGTVVGVRGSGPDTQATVNFDRHGQKRLLLRYAPMRVL